MTFVTVDFGVNGTPEEQELGQTIRALLHELMSDGVRIEACEISCEWLLPPEAELYPGIVLIDNAFASSIWYQTKGYAMINID
ncbi:MAG: hypothetical protein AMJ53_01410 [Gammaproteobacteria bacterium SG8_11]|nr:MAG: hypothetical protein AMJ53_01410 [Gammaproteobacteria bacterium SG8_11]